MRFLKKIHIVDDKASCWNWTASTRDGRYGCFGLAKKIFKANRVAFELFHGAIPYGHYVLHHCDNTLCVRPEHLFSGTQQDNMDDMVLKARSSRVAKTTGSSHGMSKLNDSQALSIFMDARQQMAIAIDFQITKGLVSQIKNKRIWKHIHQ